MMLASVCWRLAHVIDLDAVERTLASGKWSLDVGDKDRHGSFSHGKEIESLGTEGNFC